MFGARRTYGMKEWVANFGPRIGMNWLQIYVRRHPKMFRWEMQLKLHDVLPITFSAILHCNTRESLEQRVAFVLEASVYHSHCCSPCCSFIQFPTSLPMMHYPHRIPLMLLTRHFKTRPFAGRKDYIIRRQDNALKVKKNACIMMQSLRIQWVFDVFYISLRQEMWWEPSQMMPVGRGATLKARSVGQYEVCMSAQSALDAVFTLNRALGLGLG